MRIRTALLSMLALACCGAATWSPSAGAATHALIVGCSDYGTEADSLPGVLTDVRDMYTVLTDIYGVPATNVVVHTNTLTTGDDLEAAISKLLSHADADLFVLYLGGHGDSSAESSFYDMPNGVFFDYELSRLIGETEVQSLVVVDTCHAGGFASNCASASVVVMTASSIHRDAWDIEVGDTSGGLFTKNLCDGFAWHNNDYATRRGDFIDWPALGWSTPSTSDDDLSGVVTALEAFDYADDLIGSVWESWWGLDSDPQISGSDQNIPLDVSATAITNMGITVTLTAPEVRVVAPGGSLGPFYSYTENHTDTDRLILIYPYNTTPSGVSAQWFRYGMVIQANSTFLANGGSGVTLRIPANAPLGAHAHNVKVYGIDGTLLDQASFTFEVALP